MHSTQYYYILSDPNAIFALEKRALKRNRTHHFPDDQIQSNLDYPDVDYPDFSIIRTFSLVPFFSWILISFDLKSFQR